MACSVAGRSAAALTKASGNGPTREVDHDLVNVLHGLDLGVGEFALALVCSLAGALALEHLPPVLVHLQLHHNDLAGVDAHIHGSTCSRHELQHHRHDRPDVMPTVTAAPAAGIKYSIIPTPLLGSMPV